MPFDIPLAAQGVCPIQWHTSHSESGVQIPTPAPRDPHTRQTKTMNEGSNYDDASTVVSSGSRQARIVKNTVVSYIMPFSRIGSGMARGTRPYCRKLMPDYLFESMLTKAARANAEQIQEPNGGHSKESIADRRRTAAGNPWRFAVFFVAAFIILFLLLLFASFTVNILNVAAIAFVVLLLVIVVGALQLRHEHALSEKGFITVVRFVVRNMTNAQLELSNKLTYASLTFSVILTMATMDPALSLSPYFWIVPFLASIGFVISLHSFFMKRHDFLRSLWHLTAVCFAGLAAVLWSRYISAIAAIVAELAFAGTIGLGCWLRNTLIAGHGRYRRLVYLGLIVCALVPAAAIVPHLAGPPTVLVSPKPKFVVLEAGGTRTLSLGVASVYGDAWDVRLAAESPELIAVYLDTREKGPLTIQYLEQGKEQQQTMSVETSPQITNGTYDVKVNFEYTDALGRIYHDSTEFQVLVGPYPQPRCIISTIAFGSEVSPVVQSLRNFRDHLVLSTKAGSAFIAIFNNWYYSFSPAIAEMIAPSDQVRTVVRISLYPLLGILCIGTWVFSVLEIIPELSIVVTGLVVSSLIGLVYLTPFTFLFLMRRRCIREFGLVKGYMGTLGIAFLLLMAGQLSDSFLLLAIGSCTLVLSCLVLVPMIVSGMIARRCPLTGRGEMCTTYEGSPK